MAILNRFSAIRLYCDSTRFLLLAVEFWRFQARDSGNRAIRDSVPLSSNVNARPSEPKKECPQQFGPYARPGGSVTG